MRLSIPTLILACSAYASASFYLATEGTQVTADQPNEIKWDVTDFSDNVDIFVGDEDADEDSEVQGKKIADSAPNVGTFTWVPDKGDAGKKKKKIWGKDKKGKKGKGKKLIDIIVILLPGLGKQPPGYTTAPGHPAPPQQQTTVPGQAPPPQITQPGQVPPGHPTTTITSIGTLTKTVPTYVTKPVEPPGQPQPTPPVVVVPVPAPVPAPVPSEVVPGQPPVATPVVPGEPQLTAPPDTLVTRPPTRTTASQTTTGFSNTLVNPSGTGVSPPIFTGAAVGRNVQPVLVGGVAGLFMLGMM